jgi:hypothetical protein
MKKLKITAMVLLTGAGLNAYAGNEDRVGSAGATELLINPWTRNAAMADAGVATCRGIESMFMNVAGLAFTKNLEVGFVRSNLYGFGEAGIAMNSMAFGKKIGEQNSIGLTFTSLNFGDIPVTTVDNPEGTGTFFSPRYMNLGIAFARAFSNSIYGGIVVRAINQSITNVRANGVAFDAGIQYVTGEKDQIKFGINLKNVGPPMSFSGDGLSQYTIIQATTPVNNFESTTEQRSARFELPSQVNVSFGYDFLFGPEGEETQKLTLAGTFTSNSFSKDNYRVGAEYSYSIKKAVFAIRAGYNYEKGIFNTADRSTSFTGPSAGISVDFGKDTKESTLIGIDYSYRFSSPLPATHMMGIRIMLK